MNQSERRSFLIKKLLNEQPTYQNIAIPEGQAEQKQLLRSLMNIRAPAPIEKDFLAAQDVYLQEETAKKGIVELKNLQPVRDGIYLWQGDITTLQCDAIVNAANSQMTGCYVPCHGCIDNCIHTYAGIQLRLACAEIMKLQEHQEETGQAKITSAYNLPCKYVIHTVGPIVSGKPTPKDEEQLASCYRSCLALAEQNHLESIAFCCISTGEFHFPNDKAAKIAVQTVMEYQTRTRRKMEVLFNVFKDSDYQIYKKLLVENSTAEKGTRSR